MFNNEKLKKLRKKNGLTQADMAVKVNIRRETYTKYETNAITPPPDMILTLANIFDVSTDYLLDNTDDPKPPDKLSGDEPTEEEEELLRRFLIKKGLIPSDRPITEEEADRAFRMFKIIFEEIFPQK